MLIMIICFFFHMFVCFISLYSQCAEYTSVDNDDKFVSYVCLFYKFILPVCRVHEC